MQNRNNTIEERLQIINDYIQRTMDALNATRQVVQGLSTTTNLQNLVPTNVSGISHSTFVPQLVQTPYGVVAISPQTQIPQVQGQLAPLGFGLGYGLNHASWLPQVPAWGMNQLGLHQQLGLPQVGLPQVGMVNNLGWHNGLNHTQFVPSQVSPWGVPMTIAPQWPINQQVSVDPRFVQVGVPTQTF